MLLRLARSKLLIIAVVVLFFASTATAIAPVVLYPAAGMATGFVARTIVTSAAKTAAQQGARWIPTLIQGGVRNSTTGVITGAKQGWIASYFSAATRSKILGWFLLGTSAVGLTSDVIIKVNELRQILANDMGFSVDENGNLVKPGSAVLEFTDNRAFSYYLNYTLPGLSSSYRSPHTLHVGGVYLTPAEAQAAANLKRQAIIDDPGLSATTVTVDSPQTVAVGVTDPAARVTVYQVGSTDNSTFQKKWYYYAAPYPGTANAPADATPEPVTQDDIEAGITPALESQTGPLAQPAEDLYKKLEEFLDKKLAEAAKPAAQPDPATTPWRPGGAQTPADDYQKKLIENIPPAAWPAWDQTAQPVPDDASIHEPTPTTPSPDAESTPDMTTHTTCAATRFQEFLATVQASSLGQMWASMFGAVPSGGACSWTVNVGETFGGTQTIDWCGWAAYLAIFKATLLLVASYAAFRIIMGSRS